MPTIEVIPHDTPSKTKPRQVLTLQSLKAPSATNIRSRRAHTEHFARAIATTARSSEVKKAFPDSAHWSSVVMELNLARPWLKP